ncbi:type II toxin-antitoxin system RelE/ParE family toxin [Wolbachia endosymbiont of Madathamugadia hiepei]|uniref:type II toxin-antitoxin system RelE family toxin n=1 Tax=Wolbachia endosymbiont of Madathamugadia hiepei TaxID=1241303 RepID=UPI00158D3BD9|nr:type II toxin-antitoxin system RelE/ParE family toxin [Wolbachia endosymbiont of Madathamugadia hiepei]NUX01350.1 type II toxin-antitoxin system RelE/ParE family toxin [Wolbachia endosymbiont of Madathamugadia hiepei]
MEIELYEIEFLDNVTERDLPKTIELGVKKAIEKRLKVSPDKVGKSLSHDLKGYRRIRVGDYRMVYQVNNLERIVKIVGIRHREYFYDRH